MNLLSESVPADERGAYGDLAIAALDLLTLYDRLLDMIGWFARNGLRSVLTPALAYLAQQGGKAARDVDKGEYFVKLADGLGASGDRSEFVNTFKRVAGTRNYIAHASDMVAVTSNREPSIAMTYYHGDERKLGNLDGKSRITKRLLARRLLEASWLISHVEWARQSLDLGLGPYFDKGAQGTIGEPPVSPGRPV